MNRRRFLQAAAAAIVVVPLAPLIPKAAAPEKLLGVKKLSAWLPISDETIADAMLYRTRVATIFGFDPEYFPVPARTLRDLREAFWAEHIGPRQEHAITLFGMQLVPLEEATL